MADTLSYNEQTEGWPSYYSFFPEWMEGMNNRFYSFKGGNLHLHNSNDQRGTFYGATSSAIIQFCANKSPLEAKLFKALSLQSDTTWEAIVATDEVTGTVLTNYYEKKEGMWFSNIRFNSNSVITKNRSFVGIGNTSDTVGGSGTTRTFTFASNVPQSIISIGDTIFYGTTPTQGGVISSIVGNVITATGSTLPAVGTAIGLFVMASKNVTAESYGLLGDYAVVTLVEDGTNASELFSVEFDVMKSYP